MKILLSRGMFTEVDTEDFVFLSKFKWSVARAGKYLYAGRKDGKKSVAMHRLIMGAKKGELVDHKDGNTLNNKKGNLRICNKSQNAANAGHKKNKYGFKGVCKNKKGFMSHVMFNRKYIHCGTFKTIEEAARAYDKKAKELWGDFAKLNFSNL